jgi:hypothetical protein
MIAEGNTGQGIGLAIYCVVVVGLTDNLFDFVKKTGKYSSAEYRIWNYYGNEPIWLYGTYFRADSDFFNASSDPGIQK